MPRRLALLLPLLAACPTEDEGPTTAPTVAEPISGQVFDRCQVRVRMTEPGAGHGSWRINGAGGDEVRVDARESNNDPDFLFAVTLVPGANHLEVGRCDNFDFCGWTAVDVQVDLRAGSPDPSFAGAGQILFDHTDITTGFTILDDGRPLYASWAKPVPGADPLRGAVYARKLDGKVDTTFGEAGVAFPPRSGLVKPIAITGGGFLMFHIGGGGADISYVSRHDRAGAIDSTFGVAGIVDLPLGVADVVPGLAGTVMIGGVDFVAEIAANGTIGPVTRFAPGPLGTYVAYDLDPSGTVAILFTDRVVLANLAGGLVTTFGVGGTAPLSMTNVSTFPSPIGSITVHAGGVAVAQAVTDGVTSQVRVTLLSATGAATTLEVPFKSSPSTTAQQKSRAASIIAAPDGALYVASTIGHPAIPAHSWNQVPEDGSDLAIARIRSGAIDPTFGTAGIAYASLMLAWKTVAVENQYDIPVAMAIGPSGAPWLLATSVSTDVSQQDLFTARGPGLGIVAFKP